MNNILLAWLISMLILIAMMATGCALLEWGPMIARAIKQWCGRVVKSQGFISVLVVVTAVLPLIGVVTAFWTGDWRYLVMLFFAAPFFV